MKLQRIIQPDPIGPTLVDVGESKLPSWWKAEVADDEGTGEPTVSFRFEVRDGVPECREVHIVATDDGHEVRYTGLVGIRVADVMEESVTWLGVRLGEDGSIVLPLAGWKNTAAPVGNMRRARAGRKVTDKLLREVAEVYRANVDDKPTKAVSEHFGKSHRTATLYVKTARDKGFLGAAIKGKAGER